jgi:hypothetical protein
MKLQIYTALLIICLSAVTLSAQEAPVANEDNCRKAITAGIEQLHRIPPGTTQRDEEARKKLLADMERLVETNRRQGVSECRTWAQMMGKAFNQ